MKINNVFLTFIFCIFTLSAWAQSDNLSVVRDHYPEIYASIQDAARQQWDDAQVRQAVMEGQAQAFLALAESQDPMDSGVLAEAILNNSLPGQREHNTKILNDLSIENPFPLLKADWFKAKTFYDRRVTSQFKAAVRERQTTPTRRTVPQTQTQTPQRQTAQTTNPPAYTYQSPQKAEQTAPQRNVYKRETLPVETEEVEDVRTYTYVPPVQEPENVQSDNSRDSYFDEYNYQEEQTYQSYGRKRDNSSASPIHLGLKIGGGMSSMYNLGSYLDRTEAGIPSNLQVKSKLGLMAEGGLAVMYKSSGFFAQNETTVQYSQAKYTAKTYTVSSGEAKLEKERDFDNSYLYLQTGFHFGGYYELDKGIHLLAGVGPYVGFKLNADYDDYGIFDNATPEEEGGDTPYQKYMKDGEKSIMFGVSGVFGADINKFRIALYPSMGLTKIHDKEEHKPFGLSLGLTYWFF